MNPIIISENDFKTRIPEVVDELLKIQTTTMLPMSDGIKLYCEQYLSPNAYGNIVILHGFTEFAEKYKEMIKYYLELGLNVFIYDQRGHGLSDREVDDLKRIHVGYFMRYVEDLETVVENLVNTAAPNLPLYLFSHSMGGAIAALYVMKHPKAVKKSVMCAPMISPKTHKIPRRLVLNAIKRFAKRDGWNAKFGYTSEFNPNATFREALDGSKARFEWVFGIRLGDQRYQTSAATNSWMKEAIEVKNHILKKQELSTVETEILVLSAQNDTVVKNRSQKRFAKMVKNCRLVSVENSKHNIYFADQSTISEVYQKTFDFLKG